jgi:CRP-like cAMP-binding protein
MIESSALRKYALFGGLTEEQIAKILPLMEDEEYEEGCNIIVEGEQNDKIYFIEEGRVVVSKEGIVLSQFGEGDTCGEMEVLDIMPSAATIKSTSPVRLLALSNKTLHEIYKTDLSVFSMLVMNLARDLSRRLRKMNEWAVKESPPVDWG